MYMREFLFVFLKRLHEKVCGVVTHRAVCTCGSGSGTAPVDEESEGGC